jgi:predicted ATP-dependent endonuclease of OLD family
LSFGKQGCEISDFKDLNIFVGPNDSGKTNVIRTIIFIREFLKNPLKWRTDSLKPYLRNLDEGIPFEINIKVKLNNQERRYAESFLLSSFANGSHLEIFNSSNNPEKYPKVTNNVYREHYDNLLEKNRNAVAALLDKGIAITIKSSGVYGSKIKHFFRFYTSAGDLIVDDNEIRISEEETFTSGAFFISGFLYGSAARSQAELSYKFDETTWSDYLERYDRTELKFEDLFSLLGKEEHRRCYVNFSFPSNNNPVRESKMQPYDADMWKFKSLFSQSSQINSFSAFFSAIFSDSIVYLPEKATGNNRVPLKNLGTSDLDVTISNISNILFKLKNSDQRGEAGRYAEIENFFKELTGRKFHVALSGKKTDEEFSQGQHDIDQDEQSKQSATGSISDSYNLKHVVYIVDNNDRYVLSDFSSSGMLEALTVATAVSGFKDKIIILDEPGSAFHPYMQRRLSEKIRNLSAGNESQYFMVTHSSFMFDITENTMIWRAYKSNNESSLIDVWKELPDDVKNRKKFLSNMAEPKVKSILYSNGVILVEGIGEEFLINSLDNYYSSKSGDKGVSGRNWTVLPVGGKTAFPRFMQMLEALSIKYFCIADNDALMEIPNSTNGVGNRDHFSAVFFSLSQCGNLYEMEKAVINSLKLTKEIDGKRDNYVYNDEDRNTLLEIAKKHKFLIMNKDLEELLGVQTDKNKLLRDIDAIDAKLRKNIKDRRLSILWKDINRMINSSNV